MDEPFSIRRARRTDCLGILAIYNEAVLTTTATYDYEPRTLEHRQDWFDGHQRDGYAMFVAVEGTKDAEERIIGWSSLSRFHDRPGFQFTSENSIYIASDRRGRGVGGCLLPPLILAAQERGLHVIIAAIDATNEASLRLHARNGFERVSLLREVGFKFGRWLDVVHMHRFIPKLAIEPGKAVQDPAELPS